MAQRRGQCICGAVTVRAETADGLNACHCKQCQRWTGGGPYLSVQVHDLKIAGEEHVLAFQASAWGERGTCRICGATLYWRMQGKPVTTIAVGLLDDTSGLTVTEEIFVDYRPDWLAPFPGAAQSTEAQEMAKLQDYLAGEKS